MIKLIAFDLDNTLLNSNKEITPATLETLEAAAKKGIEIVPATGRFWNAVPDGVKAMKFIHYAITLNGAEIFNVRNSKVLARFEIPLERAITIARVLDELPVIYDCIIDGRSFIKKEFHERLADFAISEWQLKVLRDLRTPVEDVYTLMRNKNMNIQKMQLFTLDMDLREKLLQSLPVVFPQNIITTSVPNNIEINDVKANKGNGLKFIAKHAGIKESDTLAFGDGLNDVHMMKAAGVGIAMENACDEVKAVAAHITSSCDNDGVAEGIKKFCFGTQE